MSRKYIRIHSVYTFVTSSINTSDPVPLKATHADIINTTHPPYFTEVVCFGTWAVPILLQTFFFSSFWYRLIFISNAQVFLAKLIEPFYFWGWLTVYTLWRILCIYFHKVFSLWQTKIMTHLLAGEYSSLDCMLLKVLLWSFCDHPPVSSSGREHPGLSEFPNSPVQPFFFLECTKLLIRPLLTFLPSLLCIFFSASGWSVSLPLGAPLIAYYVFTATASKCKHHTLSHLQIF